MALIWFKVSLFCAAFFLVSSTISAAFSCSESGSAEVKEFVLSLDQTNFTDYVGKNKLIVVEFYATWCGICEKFAPEFEKAAEILSKEDPPVVFAKVDASKLRNSILAYEFKVVNHPTVMILRNGGDVIQNYKGPLDANGIVYFMKKENRPATSELKSADEVNSLVGDMKIVIVGIFPEFSGERYENFTTLAERLHSKYVYELRHTSDAKLLPYGDSSMTGPGVRIFKPFDDLFLDFQEFDVDLLEKAIEESSAATVSVRDNDSRNRPYMFKFFNTADNMAILFINSSQDQQLDNVKAKFHEVAKEYKGKGIRFSIFYVDANGGEFHERKDDQLPLLIIGTNDRKTYVKPNIESHQISAWVMEFKEGKLKTYKKPELITVSDDVPVKVVFKLVKNDMQKFEDIEEPQEEL